MKPTQPPWPELAIQAAGEERAEEMEKRPTPRVSRSAVHPRVSSVDFSRTVAITNGRRGGDVCENKTPVADNNRICGTTYAAVALRCGALRGINRGVVDVLCCATYCTSQATSQKVLSVERAADCICDCGEQGTPVHPDSTDGAIADIACSQPTCTRQKTFRGLANAALVDLCVSVPCISMSHPGKEWSNFLRADTNDFL